MTDSEAIDLLKIEKECINRDCDRDCSNCDIVQNVDDLNNAYDIAIDALEKQIPKKPIIYNGTNRADCPICNKTVRGIDKHFGNYCSGCGQKLDWSDTD